MSFVILFAALFSIGLYGVLARRDIIGVLASVEVMLGAATVLLVGLGSTLGPEQLIAPPAAVPAIGLLVIVVIAAEASIGLALMVAVARRMGTTRIDEMAEVKG